MKLTNRFFKHFAIGVLAIATPVSELFAVGFDEPTISSGVSAGTFYTIASILAIIIIAILLFIYSISKQISPIVKELDERKGIKRRTWLERMNETKSVDADSEAEIDLGHDYDGIRELDNPTPPWWRWGFRISIAFAFIYLWVYFIGKNAPLQLEELAIANAKAEIAKQAYLAKAGNMVDENNIPLLENLEEIEEGHRIYLTYCAACHTEDGGGSIGPNLTDDYWLHGGQINDIFKTIKYGIQGTGMRDWQNDFSDKQIVQIANFVHSLKGTQPQNPKEPEGELEK